MSRPAALGLGLALLLGAPTGASGRTAPTPPAPSVATCSTGDAGGALADLLRNRLEAGRVLGRYAAGGENLRARNALPDFYLRRDHAPAWVADGAVTPCGLRLVENVRAAGDDGLDPADYHLAAVDSLLVAKVDDEARRLVDLDLLLTDAFLTLGSHLLQGRVNPATLDAEWLANRRNLDMATTLDAALASGDIDAAFAALHPAQPEYQVLRERLAELRPLAEQEGWGTVPEGATLRPGERDARVPALRRRMRLGGDLEVTPTGDPELFDDALADAVVRFQERHGLDADGAVGRDTREALNVPVEARIRQVAVNMERWRWLPEDLGDTHIRVNIAGFRVEVWEEDSVALEMRAVVGREYRQTPMFSSSMTYLVLAPYWHVPPRIAAVDKLPEIKRNTGYLAAQRMTVLDQATNRPVDPATVDWASLSGAELNRRYRLRQDPGPQNALGQVKFMFPNRHSVYLHDTPSRELFARSARAFSSGCIRLERPLDLADYLLRRDPSWTPERIRAAIATGSETTVRLARPVPVHILYWTVWVDDDGRVQIRPDLYGRDGAVSAALDGDPPAP